MYKLKNKISANVTSTLDFGLNRIKRVTRLIFHFFWGEGAGVFLATQNSKSQFLTKYLFPGEVEVEGVFLTK